MIFFSYLVGTTSFWFSRLQRNLSTWREKTALLFSTFFFTTVRRTFDLTENDCVAITTTNFEMNVWMVNWTVLQADCGPRNGTQVFYICLGFSAGISAQQKTMRPSHMSVSGGVA